MPRGRPRKGPIPFDLEQTKEFIKRYFNIERELQVLKEDKMVLKDEFKGKVDPNVVTKVARIAKLKLDLKKKDVSDSTVDETEKLILDTAGYLLD
jgi:hypothetical protein